LTKSQRAWSNPERTKLKKLVYLIFS
jgi:hypothetical protein